jgi:hypothetical protein
MRAGSEHALARHRVAALGAAGLEAHDELVEAVAGMPGVATGGSQERKRGAQQDQHHQAKGTKGQGRHSEGRQGDAGWSIANGSGATGATAAIFPARVSGDA